MSVSRTAQIFSVLPIISGTGRAMNLKFGLIHSQGPSKQKPMENLGEKVAWAYPGTELFTKT